VNTFFNASYYKDEILSLWNSSDLPSKADIADHLIQKHKLSFDREAVRKRVSEFILSHAPDRELVIQNVKLAKEKQSAEDKNRIANKSFREYARIENAVVEYAKSLADINKAYGQKLSKISFPTYKASTGGVGIIHLTDLHGNELIDLPHNKYDFNIFSKRLKKHISESLRYFEFHKVSKVLIAFTGDLLNSDRRRDELLSQSTNRAKATAIMVHVLTQAISDVRMKYPVSIVSVLGNESRADKEMTFGDNTLSDNYDFTIVAQLAQIFKFSNIKNVEFKSYQKVKEVVKVGNQNWLLCHNLSGMLDSQTKTQSELGLMSLSGHKIDFIIGGHIHATRITDISARSASMAGSNAYNENALGLMGRASQNCYVVNGDTKFIQVNDLQITDCNGYEVVSQLEAYNAKSIGKVNKQETIFKIVI